MIDFGIGDDGGVGVLRVDGGAGAGAGLPTGRRGCACACGGTCEGDCNGGGDFVATASARPMSACGGRWMGLVVGLVIMLVGVLPVSGQDAGAHLVIISGLSGEERFAREYLEWGRDLAAAAVERHGIAKENVVWLAEDAGAHDGIRDRSTRVNVEREMRSLAQRAGDGDRILILLFGHGSFQAGESRINLPGPDINGKEFAALLAPFASQRVAIVNAASASGGFVQDLAAANRIVITATKSGMEANETVFGRYITAALTGDAADTDKDGRVSLREAFEYARLETEREYQRANKLKTEHAVLDAVGDGRGVAAAEDGPHAQAASSFHLGSVSVAAAGASPELRALYEARSRIEDQLNALRGRREAMPEAEYEAELERLLVELSRTAQSIRRLEGGGT